MAAEMGELVVGAYLKEVVGCDFVDYNVRPPGGGRAGQFEFDVLGLHLGGDTAYLCEVATHLGGLNYGGKSRQDTLDRIARKHGRQRDYAKAQLRHFRQHRFMLWSPYVPVGFLTDGLARLARLELVVNGDYTRAMEALREQARATTRDAGNAFFRALQILEHLRPDGKGV
jgi:hypothetical protein